MSGEVMFTQDPNEAEGIWELGHEQQEVILKDEATSNTPTRPTEFDSSDVREGIHRTGALNETEKIALADDLQEALSDLQGPREFKDYINTDARTVIAGLGNGVVISRNGRNHARAQLLLGAMRDTSYGRYEKALEYCDMRIDDAQKAYDRNPASAKTHDALLQAQRTKRGLNFFVSQQKQTPTA